MGQGSGLKVGWGTEDEAVTQGGGGGAIENRRHPARWFKAMLTCSSSAGSSPASSTGSLGCFLSSLGTNRA